MLKINTNETQPCWGEVVAIDEIIDTDESFWVHACEGHFDMYQSAEPYVPEIKR